MKKSLLVLAVAYSAIANSQTISTVAGTGSAGLSGNGGQATAAQVNSPVRVNLDNAGNLYIADRGNNSIRKLVLSSGVISSVAGTGTASYTGDGAAATAATLNSPADAVVDGNGNIYISDTQNQRIRKVTKSTGVISTIVGTGTAGYNGDGISASTAQVNNPYDLVIDAQGNLYFSDRTNNRVRKVTASTNMISTVAGNGAASYTGDGSAATAAGLSNPIGLVIDAQGNMYIGDYGNKVIRRVDASSGNIKTFAGTGVVGFTGDGGQATAAQLSNASEITVDQSGNVYISDVTNNRIRKVVTSTGIINTIAGNGTAGYNGDGIAALSADLNNPSGTVLDANGNMYIADANNNRVRKVNNCASPAITVTGADSICFGASTVLTANGATSYTWSSNAGSATTNTVSVSPTTNTTYTVSGTTTGCIGSATVSVIVNSGNYAQVISTVAGTGSAGLSGNGGQATAAQVNSPVRVNLDNAGNLYIADRGNNSIRKLVLSSGVISSVAGTGTASYTGDGAAATAATLNSPADAVVDGNGNIYISDTQNQRIRKVTKSTGVISTIVGTGVAGYNGDGISASTAQVNNPYDLVIDAQGNLYFSDRTNNRVRKVTASTNMISTVAGNGAASYTGDGSAATAAGLSNPIGLVIDAQGNMYIGDYGNKVIRRVDASSGNIKTFAGTGVVGFTGDGGQATAAQLSNASEITVDQSGNVYISDVTNNRIRKVVTSTGIINTIAGNGTAGYNGDGLTALSAELNNPSGTVLDANGNMYIADANNNRVRKVNNPCGSTTEINQIKNAEETLSIYPNPNNGNFTIESGFTTKQTIQMYDMNGRLVLNETANGKITIEANNLSEGIYNLSIISNQGVINKRVVIVK